MACQASGLGFNFAGEERGFTSDNQYTGRVDHRLSDADALYGSLLLEPANGISTPSPESAGILDTPTRTWFGSLHETHVFGPALVNDARLGYTRVRETLEQEQNAGGRFTFANTPTSLPSLYPTLGFAGYTGKFGNAAVSDRNFGLEDSWDFSDNISYIRGRHSFKAGFELIRAHFWNTVNLNAELSYADGLPASLGFTGSGFADFLLGVPLVAGRSRAPARRTWWSARCMPALSRTTGAFPAG